MRAFSFRRLVKLRHAAAALALALLLPVGTASARATDDLVTSDQRRSVARGLSWIAGAQQPGGYWGEEEGTKVADTSLSVLALMAGGNTVSAGKPLRGPDGTVRADGPPQLRGPYARNVLDGIRYLARKAWEDDPGRVPGYIQDDKISKMHGHGFATLALAVASGNLGGRPVSEIRAWLRPEGGAERDASQLPIADQVRWALERAVGVTERAQDPDSGGWLYDPVPNGHEGSMTITQIHALRAAQDAGVAVNGVVLRRAYQYVRDSQNDANPELFGGFAYTKSNKKRVSYALTAAALSTFFALGRYGDVTVDARVIEDGMKFLDRRFEEALGRSQWFYYGLFYGAQAIYQESDPRRLEVQWPLLRDAVLRQQRADGSFTPKERDRSREYCTAIATLTLQVPMETLPIFQRH